jgi:hypothetical protein
MENTAEPCIICFEENQEKILFDCNHSICLLCYSKLLQNDNVTCPICRKKVDNYVKPVCISIPVSVPVPVPNYIVSERTRIAWKGIICLVGVLIIVIITFISIAYR